MGKEEGHAQTGAEPLTRISLARINQPPRCPSPAGMTNRGSSVHRALGSQEDFEVTGDAHAKLTWRESVPPNKGGAKRLGQAGQDRGVQPERLILRGV